MSEEGCRSALASPGHVARAARTRNEMQLSFKATKKTAHLADRLVILVGSTRKVRAEPLPCVGGSQSRCRAQDAKLDFVDPVLIGGKGLTFSN